MSPLEFEITKVDCIFMDFSLLPNGMKRLRLLSDMASLADLVLYCSHFSFDRLACLVNFSTDEILKVFSFFQRTSMLGKIFRR